MLYSNKLISIRGILGSGKSRLAQNIAQQLHLKFNPEPIEEYRYLEQAYHNPEKFALKSQIDIFDKIAEITKLGGVMDQSIEDIVFVYSPLLLDEVGQKLMRQKYVNYKLLNSTLPSPILTIFLLPKPDQVFERLAIRGRHMEQSIKYEYIQQLSHLMRLESRLLPDDKKMILSSLDFAYAGEALEEITNRICATAV